MATRYPNSRIKKSSSYYNSHIKSLVLALSRYSKQTGSYVSGNSKYIKNELIKIANLRDLLIADMPNAKINDSVRDQLRRHHEEIEAIKRSELERIQAERSKQGLSGILSFVSGKTSLSREAKLSISHIQELIRENKMSPVTFENYTYDVLMNSARSLGKYLDMIGKSIEPAIAGEKQRSDTKEKMENKRIDDERKRAQKAERTKALAAAHTGNSRALADSVKRKIKKQLKLIGNCPYCERDIGADPEADHIYPVSLGGLSTTENMVYICKPCNSKKGRKTLQEFVILMKYDRDQVEKNLNELGKKY